MKIKKSLLFGLLALVFFAPIPWLYFSPPDFLAGQPLSFYALFFFLTGLSSAALALLYILRSKGMSIKAARIYVALFLVLGAGAYQYSGLAPSFDCFGKKLYVTVAGAAGKNCTTTCTNNDVKPCSGWSTCWDKFVSCSAAGKDQDGRNCQGCCFSCKVVCDDPGPPPAQPPTIAGSVSCSQTGSNGWCTGNATLNLTASDPQNYTLTISGNIGGTPFTCAAGKTCNKALPDGNGTNTYSVVASQSGKTASGSTTWKRDTTAPVVTPVDPPPTGSNGWFVTSPVSVSVNGSDALSGLASAQLSINGGAWQPNASLTTDGVYSISFRAVDKAGNVKTVAGMVSIDQIAPDVSVKVLGTSGANSWYISQTTVTADATDTMSGVDSILISDNGGAGQASPVILDGGVHNLTITATDVAGNSKSVAQTVYVDLQGPSITPSLNGTSGLDGWYTSDVDISASASDTLSGVQGSVEVSQDNGATWSGLPITLTDGVHPLIFRSYDKAGNVATVNQTIKVDTVAPTYTTSTAGTAGNAGWYLSPTNTTISPEDVTSGVDHVEYDQNGAGWENGTSFASSDGVNTVDVKIYDVAGNVRNDSFDVKVDTANPFSKFLLPANGSSDTVVTGLFSLSGLSSDAVSGIGAADISLDDRATWLPLSVSSDGNWRYDWNTLGLPNGPYTIWARATDIAGNQESVSLGGGGSDNEANVTLLLNNAPPVIKLTPEWFIWESGTLVIKSDYFPLKNGRIVISDPKDRWSKVVIDFDDTYPGVIQWDRRFADGTLAPSGNYQVKVSACNTYDLCAEKKATIKIPFIAALVPTQTPEVTPVATVEATTSVVPTIQPQEAVVPTTEVPVVVATQPQPEPRVIHTRSILFFVTLMALMWALSSSALSDRRPEAILAIAKTISQKRDVNL